MNPFVQHFLWEWLGKLLILCAVVAAFVAMYFIGRERGRQAQRKANVLSAWQDAAAETVVIPQQRQDVGW